jgi:hypothetical protein
MKASPRSSKGYTEGQLGTCLIRSRKQGKLQTTISRLKEAERGDTRRYRGRSREAWERVEGAVDAGEAVAADVADLMLMAATPVMSSRTPPR